jgi:putative heme-binding domain-containing protein
LDAATIERLVPCFPCGNPAIDAALARLLVSLGDAAIVPNLIDKLDAPLDQRSRMHLLFVLREAQDGWTPELRRRYILSLADMRQFQGREGMPKFIRQMQADALQQLSDDKRAELEPLLAGEAAPADEPTAARTLVKQWQLADLPELLASDDTPRDVTRGREVFAQALCIRCHRVGTLGAAVGPDLTSVGRRFSRRDVLLSILDPSAVVAEQYRRTEITTSDGRVLVGQIVPTVDFRSPVLHIAADPLRPEQITEIAKSDIESHNTSTASTMPVGLLSTFSKEEILDLLAWLEQGGDQTSSPAK